MAMTDPIADMLTRIRNAGQAGHARVQIPASKVKKAISDILKREGYILDFMFLDDRKQGLIEIELKYDGDNRSVIRNLSRESKPGCRRYVRSDEIPFIRSGLGIAILSTSSGVLTDFEAREKNVGGELLCTVY